MVAAGGEGGIVGFGIAATDSPEFATQRSSRSAAADAAPFTLLRELRAADRLVMRHGEVWKDWPPATASWP